MLHDPNRRITSLLTYLYSPLSFSLELQCSVHLFLEQLLEILKSPKIHKISVIPLLELINVQ